MLKAITFDVDMTLVDFWGFKKFASDAAAKAMVKSGLNMSVSKCKKLLFDHYITDIEGDMVLGGFLKKINQYDERILAAGINAYLKAKYAHLEAYTGAKRVLNNLKKKGLKLGVISDAPKLKMLMRLDAIGLAGLFDVILGFEDTKVHKPSFLPFIKALKKLKVKPAEAMHVGDWPERDIKGAKKIGMKSCLANYGYKKVNPGKYVEPDFVIEKLSDLIKVVDRLR